MLGHAWLVTALNPKSITFFCRLPCRPSSTRTPDFLTQMLVFEDDLPGAGLRQCLRLRAGGVAGARPGRQPAGRIHVINRTGGGLLIGAGVRR